MADFLLEIGVEEIPARMIASAAAELAHRVDALLARERLFASDPEPESTVSFSTPRRLAVLTREVLARQADREELLTGPSAKVAYAGGAPTKAAEAFARKAGVNVSDLAVIATPKGEYVSATVRRHGASATELLAGSLPQEIAGMSWPKTMYWREGKPERFIRPIRWLVALLDETIIPFEFAGLVAGNQSYGHRVLYGDAPITIRRAADYPAPLEAGFVVADAAARRQRIRKGLDASARTIPGARWREDPALVDQVTNLTEWPGVITGSFEPDYLSLPEEVLVTVMRDHQKYFALEDPEGKLAPHFLAVLNTEADAAGREVIRHGNERVLRARFNDASFFWSFDQRIPLRERVELLKKVTFQKDLGSYFSKTEINLRTAKAFAAAVVDARPALDLRALEDAVLLAKTDLTTELVKEFTELQGVIGGLYAHAQGLGEAVAAAIGSQYTPASMEDPIPPTVEGQILGLADRMASLVEMFAIGLEPTGSRDPFALRRAANGVIKILAESNLPLTLSAVEEMAIRQSVRAQAHTQKETLAAFLLDRVNFYLRDVRGYVYDVVNATLAAGLTTIPDALARAQALTDIRGSEDLVAISTAFKRIKNILRQAADEGTAPQPGQQMEVAPDKLAEPAERNLHEQAARLAPEVERLRAEQRYPEALERAASLRPAVDEFFDRVMVMDPDENLRRNRLALIASVLSDFTRIADFSEIVN